MNKGLLIASLFLFVFITHLQDNDFLMTYREEEDAWISDDKDECGIIQDIVELIPELESEEECIDESYYDEEE